MGRDNPFPAEGTAIQSFMTFSISGLGNPVWRSRAFRTGLILAGLIGWAVAAEVDDPVADPAAVVISGDARFTVLTPWLVRNYGQFHSGPFRLTTLEGISLYEAVYPEADGGPKQDKINKQLPPDIAVLNEAQRNDEWNRRGWEYVRTEPLRVGKLALIKIGRTWSPWFNAAEFRIGPIQWGMTLWNVPVLALALLGLGLGMRRDVAVLLVIPIGYFTAVHALFLGSVRYRAPLMPLVCILTANGIVVSLKWLSRSKRLTS